MGIEEELLAKGISYLNKMLQKNELTNVDVDLDKYDDGTKRISVTVDYKPEMRDTNDN